MAVTPSKILSSVAVEVIVVPLMDNASVSNDPSISPFPEISNVAASSSPEAVILVAPLKAPPASVAVPSVTAVSYTHLTLPTKA